MRRLAWCANLAWMKNNSKAQGTFEFFCRNPEDWFEGANFGHLMTVAFESDIDDDAERLIAKHLKGAKVSFDKLCFSGRVMKFFMGGRGLWFLSKAETFARNVNAELPVKDVVFHGMRAGDSGHAHAPAPAADMNFGMGFPRPIDDDAPPWKVGKACTEELHKLNKAAFEDKQYQSARAGIDKALAKQKDGPVQVHEASAPEAIEPDLSLFQLASKRPVQKHVPGQGPLKPMAGDYPYAHGVRSVARIFRGDSLEASAVAVIDGKSRVEFELGLPIIYIGLSHDGSHALFGSNTFIGHLDLVTGAVTPLPSPNAHEGLRGITPLANGCWAALNNSGLYVFDKDNTLVAHNKMKATNMEAFAEGYGLAVYNRVKLTAFSFVHNKLKALTKFGFVFPPLREVDDTLFFTTPAGDLALTGAHTTIKSMRAAKPGKSKAKAPTCELLTWALAPGVEPPLLAPAELPEDITAVKASSSPSGEWVAFQNAEGLSVLHKPTASITRALPECTDFNMTNDGQLVAFGFGHVMWRHKPERAAREWPGTYHSLSGRKGHASYVHADDLMFVFFDGEFQPAVIANVGQTFELVLLAGLRGAFEHEGITHLKWDGVTIKVEGLKQMAQAMVAG